MPKIVKKYGKISLILGLILVLLAMYLAIPISQAATINNREIKISDSRPSATGVTYDFEGDHSSTTVKCLQIQFCTTATGTCTTPTGMSTTSATKDSTNWYGWTASSWTIDATTEGTVKYTNATGEAGGTNYSFSTGTITNPSSGATYFARVSTYSDTSCSTAVDSGVAAFAIVSGVSVTATVAETLTFSIDNTSVTFGELSTAIRWANTTSGSASEVSAATLTLSTNAGGGAAITIQDIGDGSTNAGLYKSTSPTKLIPAAASSAVTTGSEKYGAYGRNASSLTIDEGFDNDGTSDLAISRSAQTFATASGAVSSATVDLALKAAGAGTTPAGSYADTVIFVATPTY
jgi:hypothetical protein